MEQTAIFHATETTEKQLEPQVVPTQTYSITFDSFEVITARSGHDFGLEKGNDTDYTGFCVQVNNAPPMKLTKYISDKCSGGNTYAVDQAFNSIKLADTDAVAIISTIINSSQSPEDTTAYLDAALTKVASAAAGQLAKFLGKELTDATKAEVIAGVAAALGTAIPGIGTLVGAVAGFITGYIVSGLEGLIDPTSCDGAIGGSLFLYSGAQLKAAVTKGHPLVTTVNYPGVDSSDGCGDNSNYNATYSIVLVETPVNIHNINAQELTAHEEIKG